MNVTQREAVAAKIREAGSKPGVGVVHVIARGDQWAVVEAAGRGLGLFPSKKFAVLKAKRSKIDTDKLTVIVHNKDGSVQEEFTRIMKLPYKSSSRPNGLKSRISPRMTSRFVQRRSSAK